MTTEACTTTTTAAGLRALADFIDGNPGVVADEIAGSLYWPVNIPVSSAEDPKAALAAFARAAMRAGCDVRKDFSRWAGITVDFGGLSIYVYADRGQVCEKVVKGTREVTKTVKDPNALAAVPEITVTETVEDIEWVCKPLLDAAGSSPTVTSEVESA